MSSTTLCHLIRVAIVAVALCGLVVCGYILPTIGANMASINPEYAHSYLPWLIFLWAAAVPCFAILALGWKTSSAVKREQVFTLQTARRIKFSAILLLGDVSFFFLGNTILLALNMSHPAVLLISIFVAIFAALLAVIGAALSCYITKAAVLQEEADATI